MKRKDYQVRNKWFYAVPSIFPSWPYKSRLAIGVKLDDAEYRNSPVFRFKVKDTLYEIDREKAEELGKKFRFVTGALPNLLPMEEFKVVKTNIPVAPEYEFDLKTNTAYLKVPKSMKQINVQLSML